MSKTLTPTARGTTLANAGYRVRVRTTRTQGRLDLHRLADEVPDWRDRETWACGPQGMLDAAERVWADAGIAAKLHLERFAVSKAAPRGQGGTVTFARSVPLTSPCPRM